jgi:hypothetical protein
MKPIFNKLIDVFFWLLKWTIIAIIMIAIIYIAFNSRTYSYLDALLNG